MSISLQQVIAKLVALSFTLKMMVSTIGMGEVQLKWIEIHERPASLVAGFNLDRKHDLVCILKLGWELKLETNLVSICRLDLKDELEWSVELHLNLKLLLRCMQVLANRGWVREITEGCFNRFRSNICLAGHTCNGFSKSAVG